MPLQVKTNKKQTKNIQNERIQFEELAGIVLYNYFYLKNEEAVRHIERHRQRKDGLLVSSGLCFIKEIKFF